MDLPEVFLECEIGTLCRLYKTCSAFYLLIREESFWKAKTKRENLPTCFHPLCNLHSFYCFSRARDLVYKPRRVRSGGIFFNTEVKHLEKLFFLDPPDKGWLETKHKLVRMAKKKQATLTSKLSITTTGGVIVLHVFSRLVTEIPSFDFGTDTFYFDHVYKEVDKEEAFRVLYYFNLLE